MNANKYAKLTPINVMRFLSFVIVTASKYKDNLSIKFDIYTLIISICIIKLPGYITLLIKLLFF